MKKFTSCYCAAIGKEDHTTVEGMFVGNLKKKSASPFHGKNTSLKELLSLRKTKKKGHYVNRQFRTRVGRNSDRYRL